MADTIKHLSEADQKLLSDASKEAQEELERDAAQYANYLVQLDRLIADISEKIKVVDEIHSYSPDQTEKAAIEKWIKSFIPLFIGSSRTRQAYDWIRAPLDRASKALEQKTKVRFQLFSSLPEAKETLTSMITSRTGHRV